MDLEFITAGEQYLKPFKLCANDWLISYRIMCLQYLKPCPEHDSKLHLMLRPLSWSLGNVEYPFITGPTLDRSGSTC